MKSIFTVFLGIFFLINPLDMSASTTSGKGIFIIQVSWDRESYPTSNSISIKYSISKKRKTYEKSGIKDATIEIELEEGEYTISSIQVNSVGYGKNLDISFDRSFTIKSGQVINGGKIFLIKSPDSDQAYVLTINNTVDAKRYVKYQASSYYDEKFSKLNDAWNFLEDEKVEGIVKDIEELLISRVSSTSSKYVSGPLGILLRLQSDSNGALKGYTALKTNTLNDIKGVGIFKDRLICTTSTSVYLYGQEDNLSFVPIPSDIESDFHVYLLGEDKLVSFDDHFNVYVSNGTEIQWNKQGEFRQDYSQYYTPQLYFGRKNVYIYTTGKDEYRKLLISPYDQPAFSEFALPDDLREISTIIETPNKLIIGPLYDFSKKYGGMMNIKVGGKWETVFAPMADCRDLVVDSNDDSNFTVKCRSNANPVYHKSTDGGKTWKEVKND